MVLSEDIPPGHSADLAFAEHVFGYITLDGPPCRGKRPKPHPRIQVAFHTPMVLLDDLIRILAWPEQTGL
jgi:hypothetical protein